MIDITERRLVTLGVTRYWTAELDDGCKIGTASFAAGRQSPCRHTASLQVDSDDVPACADGTSFA
ncbi:MAG TPA: hypothetical protein PK981_04170 [Accumulibacter sp.]|nr:hypothetical protein [Accumulibacter sp.]HMW16477.1 hypothetical protein [Accumulibacter sp.]HMX22211.1 hypothetical protein [Accumulibacter sp.]HMY07708.1 hypothetical protein [Accumulibacter sp.]HNC16854.1 hypothetical protein [Accumulibacter sp.]